MGRPYFCLLWCTQAYSSNAHHTVRGKILLVSSPSYMSATPILSVVYVSATAQTSRNRRSSSTEPISIIIEVLKTGVGRPHLGLLSETLTKPHEQTFMLGFLF